MRRVLIVLFLLALYGPASVKAQSRYGPNDTLYLPFIVYEGDTMIYREMDMVFVFGKMTEAQKDAHRKWTRLRNAVYVTYPYAKKAGYIINDVNNSLQGIQDQRRRRVYLGSREKELKTQFAEPLTALSVYQGKVLMKLINRETNNTCYELVKEYRGGISARFWQTLAWVFGGSLKQIYSPRGEDAEMEAIVQEVAKMYGHSS